MQAVVKAPHINVTITGHGIDDVVQGLKKMFTGIRVKYVDDEQEAVDPFSTTWYHNISENTTPGDRLNTERFKRSLTQNALSDLTGISQHHISEMENGKRPIGRETARKFANVFKTDYRFFL